MIDPIVQGRRFVLSVVLATAALSGCNFKDEKDANADGTETPIDPSTPVKFAEIEEKILVPSCRSCHSTRGGNDGGVNLETYAAVKAKIKDIKRTTVDSTLMPKGDKLSKNQIALLKAWIEQGAPE